MSNLILNARGEKPTLQNCKCIVKGCEGEARWKPVLLLMPIGYRFMPKAKPLPIPHNGFLCQAHKDLPHSVLLNEEEKGQIKAHLFEHKVPAPDWTSLKIGLVRVE